MRRPISTYSHLWGGSSLPRSFVGVDIETSGLSATQHVIVQIGRCRADNGVQVAVDETFIDWHVDGMAPTVERQLRELGEKFPDAVRWDELAGGKTPFDAAKQIVSLFEKAEERKLPIVGYNIYRFDLPRLHSFVKRYVGFDLKTCRTPIVDLAAVVLSDRFAGERDAHPLSDESISQWSYRVVNRFGSKAKHGLHSHCVEKYALALDSLPGKQHRAAYDISLTARLAFSLEAIGGETELDSVLLPATTERAERGSGESIGFRPDSTAPRRPPAVAGPVRRWRGQRP